jgi:hypothetical protein
MILHHKSWREWNCSLLSSPGGEKALFCPFPGLSANGIIVCHAVRPVHIAHVNIIVLYYGRFRSISMLFTEIIFCWKMMHIHQCIYVPFAFSYCCCQVIPPSSLYVTPFQFQFFTKILCHAFSIWSQSTTAVYGLNFVNHQKVRRKRNCLCTVYPLCLWS